MGSLSTGIGLISGIDTASLINQLIALESRPKTSLQNRLALLQTRQSALLDINARLLNLKTTSQGLRTNSVFGSALAASGDESVLTATAGTSAQPGVYALTVKQLVSTSQKISKGFTDSGSTPVGLGTLSFEIGRGFVSTDTDLGELNGGAGVARGNIVITDSSGASSTIDLRTATTVGEVLAAINEDSTVSVTASVDGDHLVITDTAGGAGNLTVADATGDTTATELGIAGTQAGPSPVITGTDVRTLGGLTALSSLNDGTGVLIENANPDITITTLSGRQFDVNFGRIDNPITASTLLEDLNDGAGVTLNGDSDPDLAIIDRDGEQHDIDLTGATTVGDVISRVASQSGNNITLSIHGDGDKLVVTDNTGGTGLLKVIGAGSNDTDTAEDLGVLETDGVDASSFTGEVLANADNQPAATTLQQIVDRINNAKDTLGADNGGDVVASISGARLLVQDNTAGPPGGFMITATAANPYAARDLGIEKTGDGGGLITGDRLIAGLNSVLVGSLNGGSALNGNTTLTITDRVGGSDTFALDEDGSLADIIDQINGSGAIDVTATINASGNGLRIVDNNASPTGNLIIEGSAAAELGIDTGAGGVASSTVRGTDLELRYVAEATRLSALNYGRGIGTGEFRITDGDGNQATVSIGSDARTLYDVIDEINAQASQGSVDVTASINATGDGILLTNDLGTGLIQVDSISGTTAKDLNILGQADTDGGPIDGSYEKTIAFNASDTLSEIAQKINDAGIPVSASVLDTGVGAAPFKLVISSGVTGTAGDLLVDDAGFLELSTLSKAKDAKVFFGDEDPAAATLIRRSSNTISDAISGVTINLVSASETPVELTVTRDEQAIEDEVADFVTAFNDVIQTIDRYDFFNAETEERGVLLGNPTTQQIRSAMFRTLQQKAVGVTGDFQYLSQIGIRAGAEGNLTFDGDKFRDALEEDFDAVEELFTAFKGSTKTSETIAPGVTVAVNEQTFSELGFADLFEQLADGLTDSIDGTVTLASDALEDQISLTESRIDAWDDRLEARRAKLEREFAAMEAALAQLQGQQNALLSLVGNLSVAQGLI